MKFYNRKTETERVTAVGSYWDNKGNNEIDLIAINDLEKTAIVAEVKRNPGKINPELLRLKAATVKELSKYFIEFRELSLNEI